MTNKTNKIMLLANRLSMVRALSSSVVTFRCRLSSYVVWDQRGHSFATSWGGTVLPPR